MRRTSTHSSAGFTLVELVAVLTLIGILSVTVIPAIEVIGKAHQAGMTLEIRRQLGLVRDRAVATGEPSALNFDLPQGTV
jgi:prepilin-type N-terminal cleavage/methylation domain-containing protein